MLKRTLCAAGLAGALLLAAPTVAFAHDGHHHGRSGCGAHHNHRGWHHHRHHHHRDNWNKGWNHSNDGWNCGWNHGNDGWNAGSTGWYGNL
jgi:hypothetical protein